jgi:hypothetical protein
MSADAGSNLGELCETRRSIIVITKFRQEIVVRDSYVHLRRIHRAIALRPSCVPEEGGVKQKTIFP